MAKRLCDRAAGGQILASELVSHLVGTRGGLRYRPAGRLELKGLAEPLAAVTVEWDEQEATAAAGGPRSQSTSRPGRRRAATPRRAPRGPKLAGRDAELARLERELVRAGGGEFRCVLIVGDAGVGKTRLAEELLGRHPDDTIGLVARRYPLGATVAFGLWAEAFEPLLQALPDPEVADLCGGFLDDLAGLSQRVAAVRGSVPGGKAPRLRLLEALACMLDNIAEQAPTVVVMDDAHLADASSWETLRYVARHLSGARLLVVATTRPGELSTHEVAAHVLFELEQDGLLARLELGPLEPSAVRDLAEAMIERPPPPALVQWLGDRSQGNALFTIGLLGALLEERADLSAPRLRRLPEGLAERVVSRMRQFAEPLRATLQLLAVTGRPVTLGGLMAITGRSLEELGPDVAELVNWRAVVEEEQGRDLTYAISHPLVREIVYQDIGGARRRLLHRQAGRALREAGRLPEAALHFARSAEVGDPEAIDTLRSAVRQAEEKEAYREALELLGELVELLPPGDARWLEVFEAMSWRAEWVVDHRADSHVLLAINAMRAIDDLFEAKSEPPGRRGAVKFRLANFLAWGAGELPEAEAAIREARRLFDEAGDRRQALLAARELAWVSGLQGDFVAMEEQARFVVEADDGGEERFVLLQGLAAVGYSAHFRGRLLESEEALRRAAAIAREDRKAYRLTAVLGELATVLGFQGRIAPALALFDEAKGLNPDYRDSILVELDTLVHWLAGDFRTAVERSRDAAAWSPGGASRRRVVGMVCGALSAVEAGEATEAKRFLSRARAALGGRDWSVFWQYTRYGEALLAWHEGRLEECLAGLRPAVAEMVEMEARSWSAFALVDLADAAGEAHQPGIAAAAAEDLEALAAAVGQDPYRGLSALATGWASLAANDTARAAEMARTGVAILSETGWQAHLARAHDLLGRASSERSEALPALERAVSLFEEAGATWRKARALEALRHLGSAGRRAAAAALGPESLSRREREVARLAAQGLTAREIAERLFVSERTVESHLTNVYAKLGLDSKLDLVRRASELAL